LREGIIFDTFVFAMKSSELIRMVKKAGWIEIRQTGSHKIFAHPGFVYSLPVPDHRSKEVPTGTANSILKKAGLK
jgi:predicted RNA binding protein YcfA (HicA-like mRNA interferase family)